MEIFLEGNTNRLNAKTLILFLAETCAFNKIGKWLGSKMCTQSYCTNFFSICFRPMGKMKMKKISATQKIIHNKRKNQIVEDTGK